MTNTNLVINKNLTGIWGVVRHKPKLPFAQSFMTIMTILQKIPIWSSTLLTDFFHDNNPVSSSINSAISFTTLI